MGDTRIIIVGASGTIGIALLELIRKQNKTVIPLFASRPIAGGCFFDAINQNLSQVVGILTNHDVIVLLAAYTNQAWVRINHKKSRELNVNATCRIAEEAVSVGAKVLFLSSEAVFSSECNSGWLENSPVNPSTEYGRLKTEAERIILSLPRSLVIRTGWNVSCNIDSQCVVNETYNKLLNPGAKMAFDNYLTVTDVYDTTRAIISLIDDEGEGIFHIINQPAISRSELAEIIISSSIRRTAMNFDKVDYKSLDFIEPRAASSYLKAGSRSLKYTQFFRPPQIVVQNKVWLLDKHNIEN